MADKSPRPMASSSKTPRGTKSISVKVCSIRNSKEEDLLCRVKYGQDARQTKTHKKGAWDEETSFDDIKTLTVELLTHKLLGKKSLGEAVVNLTELQPGFSSNWYPVKSKKGKERGELQLTIDIPRPEKKKISMKETEELLAANGISAGGGLSETKVVEDFDVNKAYEELGVGQARLHSVHSDEPIDATLSFQSVNVDQGSLIFTFNKPDDSSVSLAFRVPKSAKLENEYKQSPVTRLHFVHPKLQLRPSFATTIQVRGGSVGETKLFSGFIQSRAVSHELKNSKRIKGVFKVDLVAVAQALNADELGDIEKTPETVPGELVNAAFKGQQDVVEKCIERGDDVNEGDENQETALHKAVTRGYEPIIKVLVDAGADPRQPNKWGQSATDIAAKFRPELVSLLHSYQ